MNILSLLGISQLVFVLINLLFYDPVSELVEVEAPGAVCVDVGPRVIGVTHVNTPALEGFLGIQKFVLRDSRILVVVNFVETAPNFLILSQV